MVSVIIPIYNAEEYLCDSLTSILNQTYKDLEIICIDDGSTDKSVDIVNDFINKDKRIKLIMQENKGPGIARNKGLDEATGDYVTFVDADDKLPEDAIKLLYNAITDGDYDVVLGSYKSFMDNDKGELVEPIKNLSRFDMFFKSLSVWGRIYKKDILTNILFEDLKYGEDSVFLADVYLKNPKIKAISDIVYYWLRHERSNKPTLTHQYNEGLFNAQLKSSNLLKDRFNKNIDSITYEDSLYLNRHLVNTTYYFKSILNNSNIKDINLKEYYEYVSSLNWTNNHNFFFKAFGFDIDALKSYELFKENMYKMFS